MSTLFARGRSLVATVFNLVEAETVSLRLRTTGDSYSTLTGITGYRRVLDNRDSRVRNGLIPVGTIAFFLDTSTMAGYRARQLDWLVDSNGQLWGIDFVDEGVFTNAGSGGNRQRCECNKALGQLVPPVGMTAAVVSSTIIDLTWPNDATADEWKLRGSTIDIGGPWDMFGGNALSVGSPSANLIGLTPGTQYWFQLAIVINGVQSAYGNAITATTPEV